MNKNYNLKSFNISAPGIYQIVVKGEVDERWTGRLAGMKIMNTKTDSGTVSTLIGMITDQSELNGVLNTLFDNRHTIISVMKINE